MEEFGPIVAFLEEWKEPRHPEKRAGIIVLLPCKTDRNTEIGIYGNIMLFEKRQLGASVFILD